MAEIKKLSLNNIKYRKGSIKKRKRVGRGPGSGLGKTCGKGMSGQKQRSGYNYNPMFEGGQTPLNKRLQKNYAMKRKSNVVKMKTVTLDKLAGFIAKGVMEIKRDFLERMKIIARCEAYKIVDGKKDFVVNGKVEIFADNFSKGAKEKIEKVGGKCVFYKKISDNVEKVK